MMNEAGPEHIREIERRQQVAEGLRGILAVLNSTRSLAEILNYIVGEARRLLNADAAALYRLMPDKVLSIQSSQGLSDEYIAQADIPLGRLATGRAALERRPVPLADVSQWVAQANDQADPAQARQVRELASQFKSILSLPLITQEEPVGALTLYYATPRDFQQEEIDLAVAFCDQSALAIENARLRERVKEEAINAERARLARDLHDSVTQMLFSASLIAEVMPAVWNRDQAEGEHALEELRQLTRGALAEMRSMLLELRPDRLQTAHLEDLLRQAAESVSGRMRIPVQVTIDTLPELPPDVRLALYRIAQESLNNITKHSNASRVEIHLGPAGTGSIAGQSVALTIRDNGYGFIPQQVPGDHLGLSIMRERAASVGAELRITSQPGQGAEVVAAWHPRPNGSSEALEPAATKPALTPERNNRHAQ